MQLEVTSTSRCVVRIITSALDRWPGIVIIGAGPAGLTAGIYLGRYHRPPLLIDAGASRARWITQSQEEKRNTQQKTRNKIRSRFVILATGVEDHLPALRGAEEAVRRGILRICPICDAYEATGKKIAVIGDGPRGEREAEFLKTYSSSVTFIYIGAAHDPGRRGRARAAGIELIETSLDSLTIDDDGLRLRLPSGRQSQFDVFYSALGCSPRNTLAASLGASRDENSQLIVSSRQA